MRMPCCCQVQSLASSNARIMRFKGRSRTSRVTVPETSLSGTMFRLLALAKVARAERRSRSVAWKAYTVLLVSSSSGGAGGGWMTTGASRGGGLAAGAATTGCAGEVTPGMSLKVGSFFDAADAVVRHAPGIIELSPAITARWLRTERRRQWCVFID